MIIDEIISAPAEGGFLYPAIFAKDARGSLRSWAVEVSPDREHFRAVHGQVGASPTGSGWKKVSGVNIGRANETSPREQLLSEVRSLYRIKLRKGYCWRPEDVGSHRLLKPMLACDFKNFESKIEWGNPVYVQPKLDGIRCIAAKTGLWTRTGKPIISAPHIRDSLAGFFERHPDAVLDGELYHHDLRDDFQRITSPVRRAKLSEKDYEETAVLQYHVYDTFMDAEFETRQTFVLRASSEVGGPVLAVPTWRVETPGTLDHVHRICNEQGYEGTIIRLPGFPYEGKRSRGLLKRKDFDTDEAEVLSVQEGEGRWTGAAKRFKLRLPSGVEFGAGVRGSRESLTALLEGGKTPGWATVRYFGLSHDGIPRFPVVIDYGFGERED